MFNLNQSNEYMIRLEPIQGVTYTNNKDNLPIEERVFFSQGLVTNADDYRPATPEELAEWEAYKKQEEEKMNLMEGGTEQ